MFSGGVAERFREDYFKAVMFEEASNHALRCLARESPGLVCDDFLYELKTKEYFWVGPEPARWVVNGDSHSFRSDKSEIEGERRLESMDMAHFSRARRAADFLDDRTNKKRPSCDKLAGHSGHRSFTRLSHWVILCRKSRSTEY